MADWAEARRADPALLTEWQVYRMFDVQPAWSAFQYLVRERLRDEGAEVAADGSVSSNTYSSRRRAEGHVLLADVVVGSRFAGGNGDYKPPFARRRGSAGSHSSSRC